MGKIKKCCKEQKEPGMSLKITQGHRQWHYR